MSPFFCGAWDLSGDPIERRLGDPDRAAMRGSLGGENPDEFMNGPLWLAGATGSLSSDGEAALGLAGCAASRKDGPLDLKALLEMGRRGLDALRLEGHHALAFGEPRRGRLTLLRDPSGGERLYFTRDGGLLLFASSVSALLAHSRVPRMADLEMLREYAVAERMLFGTQTPFAGIEELLPGHALLVEGAPGSPRAVPPPRRVGGTAAPAQPNTIRERLLLATRLAIGTDRQVAVSLSGDLFSASVAACAVDILGAKNVCAFTSQFDDPGHPTQAEAACLASRHLGIEHRLLPISFEDFFDAIPESSWRSERPFRLKEIPALILSRKVGASGFKKLLGGEERLSWAEETSQRLRGLSEWISRLPCPDRTLRHWPAVMFYHQESSRDLFDLERALQWGPLPPPEMYYPVLSILERRGLVRDAADFYPGYLQDLVRSLARSPRVAASLAAVEHLPLNVQWHYWDSLRASPDLIFGQKREVSGHAGAERIAPGLFACCDELTEPVLFDPPPHIEHSLWAAMSWRLPEGVLSRSEAHTGIPPAWTSETVRRLAPLLDDAMKPLDPHLAVDWPIFRRPERRLNLALWHRIWIEMTLRQTPPSWEELRKSP